MLAAFAVSDHTMIQITNLSLRRGVKVLMQDANFSSHAGWHIGLTGKNGSGKSSLFALFTGGLSADAGDCQLPDSWVVAHMAQEVHASERSALDYVMDGDAELRQLQQQLSAAENADDHQQLAQLHQALDSIDAYRAPSRAAKLLTGLGFSQSQLKAPVAEFSGGWQMRLNLAKTLMCRSDLLLLDEPTNHLDLDAILWLENWIQQYSGTAIIISHDREFLDQTVEHILHLEQQQLHHYKGNYSQFERTRAERLALQQQQFVKQQQQIAHMQSFIDRFRAKATKAKQAQSRIKALERLEKIAPAHVDSAFQFRFRDPQNSPNPLLRLDNADIGYHADKTLIKNLNLAISPESRIGLLGPNGAGKSTLIKSLVGKQALLNGSISHAEHLKIGYFAQHQLQQLDTEATPILSMQRLAPKETETRLRTYLGSFGFIGDSVVQTISEFSGGEKSRLVLALLIWQKPNLLLLDEPTNHLDLEMRHALTLALQDFQGGLILVSHDRHLLRSCTDELLLVANGKAQPFNEDLDAYTRWLSEHRQQTLNNDKNDLQTAAVKVDKKAERQKAAEIRQQLSPLKKRCQQHEKQLHQKEQEKQQIESLLANSDLYEAENKEKLTELLRKQAAVQQEINKIEDIWMTDLEKLEALENKLLQ